MLSAVTVSVPRLRRTRAFSALPCHFALALAGALATAAQTAPLLQPDEQSPTVRGTVINSVTGGPIPRALVFTPGNRFAMLTDGEGHFEFDLPKPNSGSSVATQPYTFNSTTLIARKPGYLDDPRNRSSEATPGTEVTVPLLPEALIKGRVIFTEADPPLGATVFLYTHQVQDGLPRWIRGGSARTNSNGEFRFAELLPGLYHVGTNELPDNDPATRVTGKEFGFPPVYYPGVSDLAAAGTIQLSAGQTVEADVPLTRQPYYPVKIPVVNAEAISDALIVEVSLAGHFSPGYSLGYNSAEQRIEGSLPRGNYSVEAFTPGQPSLSGSLLLSVASAPSEGPSLVLTSGSSIPVHVVEEFTSNDWQGSGSWNVDGRPVPVHGPRLYLNIFAEAVDEFPQRNASLRPPRGRDDDTLILENLAPGRYWLRLNSSRGYVASATMGGVDLLHEPFTVSAGSSTPIEITMRDDTAELEATVAGAGSSTAGDSGPPHPFAPSAVIYCVPVADSSGRFAELVAFSDGKFDSPNLAPGAYRVMAFKTQQQNLPYRDADAMKAFESTGQIVHLSAGQKTTVQLQISPSNE